MRGRGNGVARPPPVNESKASRTAKAAAKAARVGLAVDGARLSLDADAALLRRFTRSEKAIADSLMKRTGAAFPGVWCHRGSEAQLLRELNVGRTRFYEILAALRPVLIAVRDGDEFWVFSEFAAWQALRYLLKNGRKWRLKLRQWRTSPRPPVIAEIENWWSRAQKGGPRRGLAAEVENSALFLRFEACGKPVDNPVDNPGERAVESDLGAPPAVRKSGLAVRCFHQRSSPSCSIHPPSTDPLPSDLGSLLSLDPEKIIDGLDPLRSLGTRATQARAPLPEREPGSPAVRQEGPERISFVLERERPKPPEAVTAKASPAPLADTETRLQGASGAQGAQGLRKPVSVSRGRPAGVSAPPTPPAPGFPEEYSPNSTPPTALASTARPDWISYPTFEATFVRLMRATKPKWRFIRTGECVAALRCVWERFCPGKPLRWLEPWLDTQIDRFTANVRQDGYQGPGFLRHMRAASVFVPIPPPHVVQAVRKPTAPEETPVEVRAAILASFAKAGGDP